MLLLGLPDAALVLVPTLDVALCCFCVLPKMPQPCAIEAAVPALSPAYVIESSEHGSKCCPEQTFSCLRTKLQIL